MPISHQEELPPQTVRASDVFTVGSHKFAAAGAGAGLLVVENGLDQNVSIQIQGQAWGPNASIWQDVGTALVVNAGLAGNTEISVPWPVLQFEVTPAGIPTSGVLRMWISKVTG